MKSIHDDLLLALDCAGHASYALVVVDDRMVVDDVYSVFGTGLLTGSARNASVSACGSHHLLILLRGRTGNEVGSISRDHLDQVLRTYSLLGAVAASVTFLGVDDDLTVHKLHSPFLAGLDTGADAYAAALALASEETGLTSFLAGCTPGKACLACSAAGTRDESDELFFRCRSHFGFHNNCLLEIVIG
jgi:hypothetical protein